MSATAASVQAGAAPSARRAERSGVAAEGGGTPARRPGRPRAEGHDARILAAAVELLERGEEVTVSRVVELSGVSRAALYRRWPSMTDLLAAALDVGREAPRIPLGDDLLAALLAAYTTGSAGAGYTEERFRLRLRLAMTDRKLAQAYWRSHVARRRGGVAALLAEGVRRGELRDDLDIDACIDLINGVFYYQFVVRGVNFDDPAAVARCENAVRVAWRGMAADPPAADAAPEEDE
ncbi:TetR/AcrR family transcriptional regulator [Microbacterium barkeri]|uniref:TetR/AcrR family transcriptional regulator n=1 Tax=Microbacterium barkeri TaxID=33917 RepID=UPI0024B00072|nr:TetR/AcrR family transcriptional regulator [Microbacterium barkeri]MDI6944387.1 TetR/AcrR family transcriptional regulator [Microbacterium barkeri]